MSPPGGVVLCLVEDDPIMGESLTSRLELEGFDCDWHREAATALAAMRRRRYGALISDIRLPDASGEELYQRMVQEALPLPPALFITGFGSIDQAVRLLRMGARDYITKPFDLDQFIEKLRALVPAAGEAAGEPVLGVSPAMRHVQLLAERVGPLGTRVLITGESGVGKEHAARYLHKCGEADGAPRPMEAVNCAGFQDELLAAELFGHEKGAFTGAVAAHRGLFERAHGGTLFLDEVGDMSPAMQAKLLRVVADGQVMRLGGESPVKVDVRLICATNRDLEDMVRRGAFREDLFYRLNVVRIHVPPLRERPEDIVWFARLFLGRHAARDGRRLALAPSGERWLAEQPWPGNVRELKHAIERACVLSQQALIGEEELTSSGRAGEASAGQGDVALRSYLEQCEQNHIRHTLELHAGRIAETADALGISRKSLWEKMRRYGIEV